MQPITITKSCTVSHKVSRITMNPVFYMKAGFQNAWWINIRESIPR